MTDELNTGAQLPPAERELADRLAADRPLPGAGFRGALGRHLAERDPGYGPRPADLRVRVSGLAGAGGLLILVGWLQAAGAL